MRVPRWVSMDVYVGPMLQSVLFICGRRKNNQSGCAWPSFAPERVIKHGAGSDADESLHESLHARMMVKRWAPSMFV